MRLIGVIPSRFASTRFPGKPLAMIMGKPMIWWVYNQVIIVIEFLEVYVASVDQRKANVCTIIGMLFFLTLSFLPI